MSYMKKGELPVFLASRHLDAVAKYTGAGRRFRETSDANLQAAWIGAFRLLSSDVTNGYAIDDTNDIECEYTLRGTSPPYHLVPDEADTYCATVDAKLKELRETDPERSAAAGEEMAEEVEAFRAQSAKPKTN